MEPVLSTENSRLACRLQMKRSTSSSLAPGNTFIYIQKELCGCDGGFSYGVGIVLFYPGG